ncbi:MAG: PEGA domain-containing protein [Planctomycetes bacterium]|nr:PEGA domain-containing protein [Planctomycetota bacterium]
MLCVEFRDSVMRFRLFVLIVLLGGVVFLSGCVERNLTITTEPSGATVLLNDEEIGESPVTVSFNWYGDYKVTIRKEGYETLKTHRALKNPWYDHFPIDFFAHFLNRRRIVDSYAWDFTLEVKKYESREKLIDSAWRLRQQAKVAERIYNEQYKIEQ